MEWCWFWPGVGVGVVWSGLVIDLLWSCRGRKDNLRASRHTWRPVTQKSMEALPCRLTSLKGFLSPCPVVFSLSSLVWSWTVVA